jgi:signal transduction histidine kinase
MFVRKRLSIKVKALAFFVPLVIMSGVMVMAALLPLERARDRLTGASQDISATFSAERFARIRSHKILSATNYVLTGDSKYKVAYRSDDRLSMEAMDRWIAADGTIDDRAASLSFRALILDNRTKIDALFVLVESGHREQARAEFNEMLVSSDDTTFGLRPILLSQQGNLREALIQLAGQAGAANGLIALRLTTHVVDAHSEIEQMLSGSEFLNLRTIQAIYLARVLLGIDGFERPTEAVGSLADIELTTWNRFAEHGPDAADRHVALHEIVKSAPGLQGAVSHILAEASLGHRAEAERVYSERYLPMLERDFDRGESVIAGHVGAIRSARDLVLSDGRNSQIWALVLACALFVIAIGALAVARRATKRLARLIATAGTFAEGDLSARAPVLANDELGHLAERLNVMAGLLQSDRDRAELLLEQTVESAEHERTQLAAELHDGPVQRLTAVLYGLERAALRLGRGESEGLDAFVTDAKEKIGTEVCAIRNMMSELRPPILDERGLAPAIRDYAKGFAATSHVEIDVDVSVSDRLVPSLETTMYRVMQEALTNVGKHAKASNVGVRAWSENGNVMLRVRDDGIGFDPAARTIGDTDHYGLTSMHERARLAGGECLFESSPGCGTTVTASFPTKPRVAA